MIIVPFFNLEGELILCVNDYNVIFIYSTRTKNYKWKCKRIIKIPKNFSLISISKYDKLYLFSENSVCEWDLITEKSTKLFMGTNKVKKAYYCLLNFIN
jgi:hypothetical protein